LTDRRITVTGNTAAPDMLRHETLTFARTYRATPARVFAAWADPSARPRWGRPSDSIDMVFEAADFRIGGEDRMLCGAAGSPLFSVRLTYQDIVPAMRIIYTEAVSSGGRLLSVSLVTVALEAHDGGTRLVLTDQIVSVNGPAMIEGNRNGYGGSLDRLALEVERTAGGA